MKKLDGLEYTPLEARRELIAMCADGWIVLDAPLLGMVNSELNAKGPDIEILMMIADGQPKPIVLCKKSLWEGRLEDADTARIILADPGETDEGYMLTVVYRDADGLGDFVDDMLLAMTTPAVNDGRREVIA